MATQVQLRGGTTSEHSTFTGAVREVTVDTDKDTVVVHDGGTAGGIPLAKEASVLPLAGGTMTGDLSLGDNVKAKFGASDDLQIYHDGSNSYVTDTGVGSLYLQGSGFVRIGHPTSGEIYIDAASNGGVGLNYDNAAKLATTSTGIDVTGTVTADGLTVDGDATLGGVGDAILFHTNTNASPTYFSRHTVTDQSLSIGVDDNDVFLNSIQDEQYGGFEFQSTLSGTGTINRLSIANNGDISFYEDTGTTPKFFWDASAERLGLGLTSPAYALDIEKTSADAIKLKTTAATTASLLLDVKGGATTLTSTGLQANNNGSLSILTGTTSASERMRIDSSGNVGIGGTTLTGWANKQVVLDGGSSTSVAYVMVNDTTGRTATDGSLITLSGSAMYLIQRESAPMIFRTANTERMRIDSSGNVGIGTSSPSYALDIQDDDATRHLRVFRNASGTSAIMVQNADTGSGSNDGLQLSVISGGDAQVANLENTNLRFLTNATERLRIQSGGGISFNGDTAAANALDDYETGTWTPRVYQNGSNEVTSPNVASGTYTKIGNQLHLTAYFYKSTSPTSASGTWEIWNLPYAIKTAVAGSYQYASVGYNRINNIYQGTNGAGGHISRWQSNSASRLILYGEGRDTSWTIGSIEFSFNATFTV